MDKCLITNLSTAFFFYIFTDTNKLHDRSLEKESE